MTPLKRQRSSFETAFRKSLQDRSGEIIESQEGWVVLSRPKDGIMLIEAVLPRWSAGLMGIAQARAFAENRELIEAW